MMNPIQNQIGNGAFGTADFTGVTFLKPTYCGTIYTNAVNNNNAISVQKIIELTM